MSDWEHDGLLKHLAPSEATDFTTSAPIEGSGEGLNSELLQSGIAMFLSTLDQGEKKTTEKTTSSREDNWGDSTYYPYYGGLLVLSIALFILLIFLVRRKKRFCWGEADMIWCPSFTYNFEWLYLRYFDLLSIFNPTFEIYVIYCIIFHTHKNLAGYKWVVLLHQLQGLIVDVTIAIFTRPVILFPLPMGYPLGLIRHLTFINTHHAVVVIISVFAFSCATIVHLFDYRFLVATGHKRYPIWHILFVCYFYIYASYIGVAMYYIYEDPKDLLQRLQYRFSCVPKDFDSKPHYMVYNGNKILNFVIFPSFGLFASVIIASYSLVFITKKRLRAQTIMSWRSTHLQKKYLRLLILQTTCPFLVVIFPITCLLFLISADIFGSNEVGSFLIGIISNYGSCYAFVLLASNRNFRRFRRPQFLWNKEAATALRSSPKNQSICE